MASDNFFNPITGADSTFTIRFRGKDGKVSSEVPRFSIGYWSIRGLGAPLRMMLSAARVDHVVLNHDLVEKEDGGWKSGYFEAKPKLRDDYDAFMNLPYLIDRKEQILVCQTNAILTYLGRELSMCGSTPAQIAKTDEILCEIYDIRNAVVNFCYSSGGTKNEAVELLINCSKHFKKIDSHLSQQLPENGGKDCHLVAGNFTAPDFHLFEMVNQLDALCKEYELEDILKDCPHVRKFQSGFEKLSENSFYLHQSTFHTGLPMNQTMAVFGSGLNGKTYQRGQDAPWRMRGDVVIVCESK